MRTAFPSLVESCQHEKGEIRDPRLNPSTRLYYLDTDPLPSKIDILRQAAARLLRLHGGCDELAAESARLDAACAAFRKA
jgi:hypothetical protein